MSCFTLYLHACIKPIMTTRHRYMPSPLTGLLTWTCSSCPLYTLTNSGSVGVVPSLLVILFLYLKRRRLFFIKLTVCLGSLSCCRIHLWPNISAYCMMEKYPPVFLSIEDTINPDQIYNTSPQVKRLNRVQKS